MSGKAQRAAQAVDTSMNVNGTTAGVVGTGLDMYSAGNTLGTVGQNVSGVSGALGYMTGAYGMGKAGADMYQNGIGVQNSADMGFNALSTYGGGASLLGSTSWTGPVAGAAAAGYGIGNVMNSIADSEYGTREDANGHRVGTDDEWQQAIIDDAIARGEDPSSFTNIVKGGLAGTAGQILDVGRGVGNWVGSLFD